MIVKLLTERHLEFLSFKGGCTGSSESTLVKMSNFWKSHALAQMIYLASDFHFPICSPDSTYMLSVLFYIEDLT